MIERYGTGIPRIKRDCNAAGVKFGYRQTVNTTIIRFDRPGAQVTYTDEGGNPVPVPADAGAGKQGKGSRRVSSMRTRKTPSTRRMSEAGPPSRAWPKAPGSDAIPAPIIRLKR